MALETGTYISDLVATNPTASDPKSQGDDHLKLVKSTVKATFPNITGAVTPTHTELNYVAGATSALQTQLNLKAPKDTATFTGNTTLPDTTVIGTVTSAEITYLSGVTSSIQTQVNARASLSSPAFTGTPTAPTASTGTATTQLATTAFVASTAFSAALPAQTGNSGKFVTTNGTTASWAFAGISQVTTATTATTLTSTPTLLQITPASYGVTVTLPDATTCSVGGPLHAIDNRGAYPVRVVNTSGTLVGFVFAGVVSYIALDNNSTAGGVWNISNNELVGASAQLLTTSMQTITACIAIDSNREYLQAFVSGTNFVYGVVYDKLTNTFGSITLIRSAAVSLNVAVLSATNQILCVSCVAGGTAFEAVTLSISGTTITVNTAATATLSANISAFADGCGLIAVGSSFVTSYKVTTSTLSEYRALSISGTTVTIGAATVQQNGGAGTGGAFIASAAGSIFIAAALTDSASLYVTPYTVSGTTITIGTGATAVSTGTGNSISKFFALGSRWCVIDNDNTAVRVRCTVASLSGTTITISSANAFTAGTLQDAIVVGSNKVLVLNNQSSNNANILTDTAGTASAGTAITLGSGITRACLYVSGTDVFVAERSVADDISINNVSCSGASPVLTLRYPVVGNISSTSDYIWTASDSVLRKSPRKVTGSGFSQAVTYGTYTSQITLPRVRNGIPSLIPGMSLNYVGTQNNVYRGIAENQVWQTNASSAIIKVECVA